MTSTAAAVLLALQDAPQPLTRAALAQTTGLSPERVSTVLTALKEHKAARQVARGRWVVCPSEEWSFHPESRRF